jgi:drug/metabolite transporter (DMT)-like permease
MGFLFLTILCMLIINLMIKTNELQGANTQVVIASNYIVASLLGWLLALANGIDGLKWETLALGVGGGVLWPLAFYLQMWGIRQYGLSLAGTVSRLSLSVPVLFALFFLGERLTPAVVLGLVGVFVAFYLLAPIRRGAGAPLDRRVGARLDRRALWYFPTLVLCFGVVDLWANLFNTVGRASQSFLFVVLIFTAAGIVSWVTLLVRRVPVDGRSFVRGLYLGVPNLGSTYFLMESLKAPAFAGRSAVVYALYSVIAATLVFALGPVVWKERVTAGNVAGVLVGIAAIVLLNL